MSIQFHDIIYSDVCNLIINNLKFEDVISLRCVSKKMHEGRYPDHALPLILKQGGPQNLLRIEALFDHVSTFAQSVQTVFTESFNERLSLKLHNFSSLRNYHLIARKFFKDVKTIDIENKLEDFDINQFLELFTNLKIVTIDTCTSSIKRIQGHPTIQELTITGPKLQYPPEVFRCRNLTKVSISNCILYEPPKILDCPNVRDVDYRMQPPERQYVEAADF
jgi:hypothetical protein